MAAWRLLELSSSPTILGHSMCSLHDSALVSRVPCIGVFPRASSVTSSACFSKVLGQTGRLGRQARGKVSDLTSFGNGKRRSGGSRCVAPRCAAAGDDGGPRQIYSGVYGPWEIDDTDRREVFFYRAGIVASSASFVTASLSALLPGDSPLSQLLLPSLDPLFALGASGLGLSLILVHIYVTPIKRFIQLLWAAGVVGSIGVATNLAWPSGESLVTYSLGHPLALIAVGPVFAALTGLVFKEGLCYGKLEAGALFFIIPTLILGHMAGMDESTQVVLLALWMVLYALFAARKFTQPVKDDIGDKSVFMFNALSDEKKAALLARAQRQAEGVSQQED